MSCHLPAHELQCDEHIVVHVGPQPPFIGTGERTWTIYLETTEQGERVSSKARVSWVWDKTLGKGDLSAIQYEVSRMKYAIERAIKERFG